MQEAGAAPRMRTSGRKRKMPPGQVEMPPPPSQEAEIHAGQVMTELETVFSNPGWRDDIRAGAPSLKERRPTRRELPRFSGFVSLSFFLVRLPRKMGSCLRRSWITWMSGWGGMPTVGSSKRPFHKTGWMRFWARPHHQGTRRHPLDIGPFPDSGNGGDLPQGLPKGIGFALIGWVVLLMILTILFGGMRWGRRHGPFNACIGPSDGGRRLQSATGRYR